MIVFRGAENEVLSFEDIVSQISPDAEIVDISIDPIEPAALEQNSSEQLDE